ncbi:hypothetical protein K402DRAFT_419547 [Aulographum hederae CBS 113979]|uniref:Uncharacterized protein n=1 Tax=Aulographum hederae CBS 113979 TaxID=1176131 RepID=A0A6G1H569_9PEZI|nr:hypothetical protein K402DRAFT_419547 [Aulographum hederae CBS 113979]
MGNEVSTPSAPAATQEIDQTPRLHAYGNGQGPVDERKGRPHRMPRHYTSLTDTDFSIPHEVLDYYRGCLKHLDDDPEEIHFGTYNGRHLRLVLDMSAIEWTEDSANDKEWDDRREVTYSACLASVHPVGQRKTDLRDGRSAKQKKPTYHGIDELKLVLPLGHVQVYQPGPNNGSWDDSGFVLGYSLPYRLPWLISQDGNKLALPGDDDSKAFTYGRLINALANLLRTDRDSSHKNPLKLIETSISREEVQYFNPRQTEWGRIVRPWAKDDDVLPRMPPGTESLRALKKLEKLAAKAPTAAAAKDTRAVGKKRKRAEEPETEAIPNAPTSNGNAKSAAAAEASPARKTRKIKQTTAPAEVPNVEPAPDAPARPANKRKRAEEPETGAIPNVPTSNGVAQVPAAEAPPARKTRKTHQSTAPAEIETIDLEAPPAASTRASTRAASKRAASAAVTTSSVAATIPPPAAAPARKKQQTKQQTFKRAASAVIATSSATPAIPPPAAAPARKKQQTLKLRIGGDQQQQPDSKSAIPTPGLTTDTSSAGPSKPTSPSSPPPRSPALDAHLHDGFKVAAFDAAASRKLGSVEEGSRRFQAPAPGKGKKGGKRTIADVEEEGGEGAEGVLKGMRELSEMARKKAKMEERPAEKAPEKKAPEKKAPEKKAPENKAEKAKKGGKKAEKGEGSGIKLKINMKK